MLLGDLSSLKLGDARLHPTLRQIQKWAEMHPRATFLDPAILCGELSLDPGDVASTLMALVETNTLRVRYKALSPQTQSLTDKTFDSPLDFDEELYDAGEHQFRRDDAEAVPIFVRARA